MQKVRQKIAYRVRVYPILYDYFASQHGTLCWAREHVRTWEIVLLYHKLEKYGA